MIKQYNIWQKNALLIKKNFLLYYYFLFAHSVFYLIDQKNKKHRIHLEACAFAQRAAIAIQQTNKSTPLYRGVCPIQGTGIIIGQDFTVVWNGKGSLGLQWRTLNQWENKDEVSYFIRKKIINYVVFETNIFV